METAGSNKEEFESPKRRLEMADDVSSQEFPCQWQMGEDEVCKNCNRIPKDKGDQYRSYSLLYLRKAIGYRFDSFEEEKS